MLGALGSMTWGGMVNIKGFACVYKNFQKKMKMNLTLEYQPWLYSINLLLVSSDALHVADTTVHPRGVKKILCFMGEPQCCSSTSSSGSGTATGSADPMWMQAVMQLLDDHLCDCTGKLTFVGHIKAQVGGHVQFQGLSSSCLLHAVTAVTTRWLSSESVPGPV